MRGRARHRPWRNDVRGRRLASYTYSLSTFPASDGAQTGADASCADGEVAIGGGVSGRGDYVDGIYLNTSRPGMLDSSYNGWTVYVDNYAGGEAMNAPTAYAICDVDAKRTDYKRRKPSNELSVPDDSQEGKEQPCDNDEVVVGGGANNSAGYADEAYLSTSAPYDDGDPNRVPDDGWRVEVNNDEDAIGGLVLVDVYAICDQKRKASAYRFVKRSQDVPDGKQRFQPAPCPSDETTIGGGVESHAKYKHGLYINTSFPNALATRTLWSGAVDNYDTPDGEKRKITVYAICKR